MQQTGKESQLNQIKAKESSRKASKSPIGNALSAQIGIPTPFQVKNEGNHDRRSKPQAIIDSFSSHLVWLNLVTRQMKLIQSCLI